MSQHTSGSSEVLLSRMRFLSVGLSVADVEAMATWYIEQLGFEHVLTHNFEDYGVTATFLRYGDLSIELVQNDTIVKVERPLPPNHNAVLGVSQLSIHVDDVEKAHEIAVSRGLPIVMDLAPYPPIQTNAFFIQDPEGNIIEVFKAEWE
ncbi:VOC family protein [Streptomyces sp. MP131-18]|uniref:VOC family protein n=1 Tax=Streptomyces sp. MP131-18 TaxID=1857892 RepID=UPI00097C2595|nr:VOC family protein [Streptomyces sp. MP131-18]ONK14139.1 lactoylglutathione lyase [Streptomyces sp. MP131-18]